MTKRIVIFRLGSLGDTIVALPCFNRIVASFPDHERIALTNIPVASQAPSLESILKPGGFIHSAVAYPLGLRRPGELLKLRARLRALGADTLIYIGGNRGAASAWRDVLFFRACGFKRIIGAPVRRDLDRNRVDPATGEMEREASRLARCLAELGPIDLEDPKAYDLRLTPSELATARAALGPVGGSGFIAVNTGGKVRANDWGLANWSAFVSDLASRHGMGLVFIGSAEDSDRAAQLAALWRGPVLDLCGKTTPRESSAVVRNAALFVGHDSGPLHLAWTAGVPSVGLFGSNSPRGQWRPIGDQHISLQVDGEVRLMPLQDVIDAAETVLARRVRDTARAVRR